MRLVDARHHARFVFNLIKLDYITIAIIRQTRLPITWNDEFSFTAMLMRLRSNLSLTNLSPI